MSSQVWSLVCAISATVLAVYCYLLSRRLDASRHVRPAERPFPSDEELLRSSEDWRDIDVLRGTPVNQPTGRRYLLTGACGNFGPYLTKLLHQRGEREIYLLDLQPPAPWIAALKGVHYINCDITSYESVRAAFQQSNPDVVFHVCAAIRFWERASFTLKYSWDVNVEGTKHVIKCLQELADGTQGSPPSAKEEKLLLYSSSAAVILPAPLHMQLGRNFKGYAADFTLSDDREMPPEHAATHSYAVSKAEADRLVRKAHGQKRIRTGVLRPGMTVCSPNDLVTGAMLKQKTNPVFVESYAQHFINSQDLAVCFLLYEKALRDRPDEVGGDGFLVTGDEDLWTFREIRRAVQVFAHRDLRYVSLPAFPLYVLAHILEAYCYARYYTLLPFSLALTGKTPAPHPKWMEMSRLFQIQPAMWNTASADVGIDDSRARKVLGYRNKFSNAQTLRWIVDTVEESEAQSKTNFKGKAGSKDEQPSSPIAIASGLALPTPSIMEDSGVWPYLAESAS